MGDFKSFKDQSKVNWGTSDDQHPSDDRIKLGAIMRIADATELMAKNHTSLVEEKEYLRKRRDALLDENASLRRRIASLQGVITRMKKVAVKNV